MIKTYNYKKIKSLLSLIKSVEIKETPRLYPPSSSDLNVVLFFTNEPRIPVSANLNVIFEKAQFSFPDGIIYETDFKNIGKFLKEIKNLELTESNREISGSIEPLLYLLSELEKTQY